MCNRLHPVGRSPVPLPHPVRCAVTADRSALLKRRAQPAGAERDPASPGHSELRAAVLPPRSLSRVLSPCSPGKHPLQKVLGGHEGNYLPEIASRLHGPRRVWSRSRMSSCLQKLPGDSLRRQAVEETAPPALPEPRSLDTPPKPQMLRDKPRSSARAREMNHESPVFIPAPQHPPISIYAADNCFGLFLGFIADCIFNVMGS